MSVVEEPVLPPTEIEWVEFTKQVKSSEKQVYFSAKGWTIRKVMGGGVRGIFEPQEFFFRYQIPCMNFFQAIA